MENNDGAKFLYFLTGVSIGALVGVFFTLHSGTGEALLMKESLEEWEGEGGAARSIPVAKSKKRTRELIADQAGESREYLLRKGRELREQASDAVERGKEVLADQRDHLVAAVAAAKQAYRAEAQSKNNP